MSKSKDDTQSKINIQAKDEDESNLESLSLTKLREIAKEKGVKNCSKMSKAELLQELDEINKK